MKAVAFFLQIMIYFSLILDAIYSQPIHFEKAQWQWGLNTKSFLKIYVKLCGLGYIVILRTVYGLYTVIIT